ncbi:MAG: hypothetical protein OEW44_00160 [Gemmatimonadota bacterium]|nr:hypothetical protein [Gemmatimonadota bacterium]
MAGGFQPPADRDERNAMIWIDHVRGMTGRAIARKYRLSEAAISIILADERRKRPKFDRDDEIERMAESLRDMRERLGELSLAELPPAYSNGRMMVDGDGAPILDAGPRVVALRQVAALEAQLATLRGLNAPTQTRVEVTTGEPEAAAALAEQAVALLHGGETE